MTGLLAVATALAASVACSSDDAETTSEGTGSTATTAGPATTADAKEATEPRPLVGEFLDLEPGTFEVLSVGTEFTFETDRPMFVPRNGFGWFVVAEPDSQGPDDRDIVVLRVSHLADPERLDVPVDELGDPWPADDFSGWLDRLPDEVVVTERRQETLGGMDATHVQLKLTDVDCAPGPEFCRAFAVNNELSGKTLARGSTYRIWWLEQAEEDPLAVVVGINRDEDASFFEIADSVLQTMEFGEVSPNPVSVLPAGEAELDFLGGVRLDLPDSAVVTANPLRRADDSNDIGVVFPEGPNTPLGFLTAPRDPAGRPLESADAVVAAVESHGGVVTEAESIDIGGLPATVIDIASPDHPIVLTFREGADDGWRLEPRSRWWIVEHPERGLLVLAAEVVFGDDDIDSAFAAWLPRAASILETLEFTGT